MKARVKATGDVIEIIEGCSWLYAEQYDQTYHLNELEFLDIKDSRDRNKEFEEITDKLNSLYTKKNAAYDNSFSKTFNSLGIISAVTRIGDKYNRLENLVKNSNIDNLGESIEDTLMELNKASN